MKTYKNIYAFDVADKIKNGKEVYILDRQKETVNNVLDIDVKIYIEATAGEPNGNRFAFWTIEEVEETENE